MPRISLSEPASIRLRREVDDPAPADGLAQRIRAARRLREHHLWDILRTLPSLAEARDEPAFRHRFRALMEREDLEGASRALVDAARPPRRLDRLHAIEGNWVARILCDGDVPRAVGVHIDRVAAVMAALVALDRSPANPKKH